MATLNLGVREMPYAAVFSRAARVPKGRTVSRAQMAYGAGGKTTGEVAKILEARYGVMRAFFDMEKEKTVIPAISQSVKGALISLMNNQPGKIDIFASGMERIQAGFKESLSMRRYDGLLKGVPTAASLRGVSHRFKQPYARRGSRPSFIDTGLYQSSFVAWMDV
jgi:hypothetical protein